MALGTSLIPDAASEWCAMPAKKRTRTTKKNYWVDACERCGAETEVGDPTGPLAWLHSKGSVVCSACHDKERLERLSAKSQEANFLLGATVVSFELASEYYPDQTELSTLLVATKDGRRIEFHGAGYEEHFLEWKEVKP